MLLSKKAWNARQGARTPVFVWIHGGDFVRGWKDIWGAGYGAVEGSLQSDGNGVILVSVNYRLGLFVSDLNKKRKLSFG